MRWMHRVRLYPSATQIARLRFALDVTRRLYNALLDQRRYAWVSRRHAVSGKAQYAELTALRGEDARIAAVYRESEDAVLHRLDLAFAAFFRRCRHGEAPGYPRFKPASRWKQLEYPHGARALKLSAAQDRVRLPGVGTVRLRKGRPIPAYGRAFVVEKNGRWYAVFECSREADPLPASGKVLGVDRGIRVLGATSDSVQIPGAQAAQRHRRVVTRLSRELDAVTQKDARGRCLNRRDPMRMKAVLRLARAKEREANARLHRAHEVALQLVRSAGIIALEALRMGSMTRSAKGTVEQPGRNVRAKAGLNRSLLDAGFGLLRRLIGEKAAYAGRRVIEVEARFSSQECSRCGHVAAGNRRRRRFVCLRCGFRTHADVNAALVIRRRAQKVLSSERTPGEEPGRRAGRAA
jgi:putative transposase